MRPEVFQLNYIVDPNQFHFGHTHSSYKQYVRGFEEKVKKEQRNRYILEKGQFFWLHDLAKYILKKCTGSMKRVMECYDVLYGPFCLLLTNYAIHYP